MTQATPAVDLNDVLQEILAGLASDRPGREEIDLIVRRVAEVAGFSFCGVLLPDAGGEHVRLAGSYAFPAEYAERVSSVFRLPVTDAALAGTPTSRAFAEGRTVVVPDVEQDSDFEPWRQLAARFGYRSMVSVPLRVRGRVIGVLNGYGAESRAFTAQEIEIVETLTRSAAVGVAIAALVDEQQETISRLRLVNDRLAEQTRVLERTETIHQDLTRLVIEGSGFEPPTMTLARLIGRPVAVWDARLRLIQASDHDFGAVLSASLRAASARTVFQRETAPGAPRYLPAAAGRPALIVAQIGLSNELLGFVTVLAAGRRVEDLDLRAVEQAATVYTLEFVKGRVERETEERLRASFLVDFLTGRIEDSSLVERARHHGLDPSEPHRALVVELEDWNGYQARRGAGAAAAGPAPEGILRSLRETIQRYIPHAVAVVAGESLVAAIPTGPNPSAMAGLFDRLHARATAIAPGIEITAGLGREGRGARLRASYEGAQRALQIARSLGGGGRLVRDEELGVASLMLDVREPERLAEFSESVLGPVIAYEGRAGGELLRTLSAVLAREGDIAAAARDLGVHVNTIKYRLRRVEELTGLRLRDSRDLLTVTAAELVYRLRQSGRSHS